MTAAVITSRTRPAANANRDEGIDLIVSLLLVAPQQPIGALL
jgi:hypothetical protein